MRKLLLVLIVFLSCFSCSNKFEIPACEKAVNNQMGLSAKMLSKKYNMRPCAITVAMPEGDIQFLELKFEMQGPLSQKEIRKILINSIHDFLNNINSDAELCSYLKNGRLDISEVGICLFFNDPQGYPIKNNFDIDVASIRKGALRYCRSDPNEISIKGIKATKESYEEALSLLNQDTFVVQ